MHVGQVFQNNPLEALAIILCLATILYCTSLVYRHRDQLDRSLVSLLGFIAVYQILRVIKDAGFAFDQLRGFDVTMNVIVSCMCLGAAMILRISCADRDTTKVQLRLVEANENTVGVKMPTPQAAPELSAAMVEASPLAMFTVDAHGMVNSWNGAAERLLGCKRKDVLGSLPPVSVASAVANAVTNEGVGASTLQFRNRDGQEIGAAAWTVALKANSGGARGHLVVLAPLSDLRDVGAGTLASVVK
ncbi:MAG TPA: PAS domain-containing protein [Bryobacteraceae bacterium]|nr:PAS domain-containing protein [Bryobacteraceae bacterium]